MICANCLALSDAARHCPHCQASPLLEDRYLLLEVLGQGAAGTTWLAERQPDGKRVALKELLVQRIDGPKSWALFERECQVLAQLRHPSIPTFVDRFVTQSGRATALYLAYEVVEGETLAQELTHRRYSVPEALEVLASLLDVIAYLQTLSPPVVHRDLKPENVVRRSRDQGLSVIDFGSVREVLATQAGSTVAGTPGFMAPEQLRGEASVASDVYAAGCICVALLSRKPLHELLDERLLLRWAQAVQVPEHVGRLLQRLLEPDPKKRPSDAAALAREVRRLAVTKAPLVSRAHRAVAAAFVVGLFGGGVATLHDPPPAEPPLVATPAPPVVAPASGPLQPLPGLTQAITAGGSSMALAGLLGPGRPSTQVTLHPGPSRCARTGTCLTPSDGLLGLKPAEVCEALSVTHGKPSAVVVQATDTRELEIAGEQATCTIQLVQNTLCHVSCLLRSRDIDEPAFQRRAEAVALFIRDRYGVERLGHRSGDDWSWSWEGGLSVTAHFQAALLGGVPFANRPPSDIYVELSAPAPRQEKT